MNGQNVIPPFLIVNCGVSAVCCRPLLRPSQEPVIVCEKPCHNQIITCRLAEVRRKARLVLSVYSTHPQTSEVHCVVRLS